MITLGIDVGSEFVKSVLLNGNNLISKSILKSSDDAEMAALKSIESIHIEKISITGVSGKESSFNAAKEYSVPVCQMKGALFQFPNVRTIINMGAHSSIAIKLSKNRQNIVNFITNTKCAGGSGSFLNAMAKVLHTRVEEFNAFFQEPVKKKVEITNFCAVFAESEVISLIHNKIPKEDIIIAVVDTVVEKARELLKRIRVEEDLVITGGVARLNCIAKSLSAKLGVNVLVPDDPIFTGAIGAALMR